MQETIPARVISLLGDAQQLKQVFLNLFVNAQEAMKSGGELRITVASDKVERHKMRSRSKLPTPAAESRSKR